MSTASTEPPAPAPGRVPLRVTLVAALVALSALGLLVTGTVVTTSIRGYLVGQVDEDLVTVVGQAPRPDRFGRGGRGGPFESTRDEYVRLTSVDGAFLAADSTNPAASPPDIAASRVAQAGTDPFTVRAESGAASWRVVVRPVFLRDGTPVLAVRAVSLREVQQTVRRLVLAELLVGLAVLILLAVLGYLAVARSLRPLRAVETTAAAIAAGDLSRRVDEGDPRTEVGRLSRALNGMLAQIETAFHARERSEVAARASEDRMRRFVADASHELRTPLTSIRGFAELYRQGAASTPEEVSDLLRRVEDEAARMGLLVEDLLLLARLDQQRPLRQEPVDLLQVVTETAEDARVRAPQRAIDVDVRGDAPPVVLGDEPRLRQVLTNLVSNALTHTPAGSPVAITVDTDTDGQPPTVRVAVHDQGPGLSAEDRARVFERFYRADKSRTRVAGGTGLGLSIVAALVTAHGGRVVVDSEPGRGSVFAVHLPLHP